MKEIRILVLGDQGVGKTSIISTIMSEAFPKNPPKKIPPVCIPPDMFVQYKDITTLLLDSSEDVNDEEIHKASVILL
jgi:Ras family protein T1